MKQNKRKSEPVVSAKKFVPRHKRAGRWIKAHQREIKLTLEALGALAIQYWFFKRRLVKLEKELAKKSSGLAKSTAKLTGTAEDLAEFADERNKVTAKMQFKQAEFQDKMADRLGKLEGVINSSAFRKYLKEKHGITDLKKLERGGKR